MIITTALASLASAVFLYQVLQPTSFLSAVRGVEISAISRATWDKMYDELRSRFINDPIAKKHQATYEIMRGLDHVEPGSPRDESWLTVVADDDNLLSRLGYATLLDFGTGAAVTAQSRFERIRNTVEGRSRVTGARLYSDEFTQAWLEILQKRIHRADVAAALATSLDHLQIDNQFAALPKLQRRLSELAAELRAAGRAAEADACTRWLGQTLLGLIESEKDAGTRLLCADLMIRSLGPGQVSDDLSSLRAAYKAQASACPPDAVHLYRAPAVCSEKYGRVWNWAIASIAAFLISVGALLGLVLGSVTFIFRRVRPANQIDSGKIRIAAKIITVTIALVTIFEFVCARRVEFGIFSPVSGIYTGLALIALGALCVPLCCFSWAPPRGRMAIMRCIIVIAIMALLGNLIALSPGPVNQFLRQLDQSVGVATIAIVVAGLMVIASGWLSPVGSRVFASTAMLVWAIAGVLALISLQVHRWADGQYQREVAAARLDEFVARLGPNWQDEYLKSARAAYDIPLP